MKIVKKKFTLLYKFSNQFFPQKANKPYNKKPRKYDTTKPYPKTRHVLPLPKTKKEIPWKNSYNDKRKTFNTLKVKERKGRESTQII